MEGGQLSLLEKDCVVLEDDILSSVLVLKCPMSYELMVIVSSIFFLYIAFAQKSKKGAAPCWFPPFLLIPKTPKSGTSGMVQLLFQRSNSLQHPWWDSPMLICPGEETFCPTV